MKDKSVLIVEHVSKKYCKGLKRSMLYGLSDIARNSLGMSARSDHLRKEEFWALNNVSFALEKGSTLGLIGPNGSGKTTLLKLLNGIFWPDRGKISIFGRVGALIEVGAGFHPLLTGRQNIYINAAILGMSKREIEARFDQIVDFADIGDFLDAPVKHYSSGMFVRLGFAVAVHCDPDILLVDEVLAVGDEGFQNKCYNKLGELKNKGITSIVVSHNMHVISTFTERVLFVHRGNANIYNNVADGIKDYTKLFMAENNTGIEKICSGNEFIKFYEVNIPKRTLRTGDSFEIVLSYEASKDFDNVDIDTVIINSNDRALYFQATNKAYGIKANLKKGKHSLNLAIRNIQINNSVAKVVIAIYPQKRSGYLFWWRIPVEFQPCDYSTGRNALNVEYQFK